MKKRQILEQIESRIFKNKVIILTGPRQVGKTTLILEILKERPFFFLDGDDPSVNNTLKEINTKNLRNRKDVGALWENFLIAERLKQNQRDVRGYFWRTTQQQEIDYIEVSSTKIEAFEFKWNPKTKARFSNTFTKHYDSENMVIHRENYLPFVS